MGKIIFEVVRRKMTDRDQDQWSFEGLHTAEQSLIQQFTHTDPAQRSTAAEAYEGALQLRSDQYLLGLGDTV